MFNMAKQPPDVISDTFTGSESPTSSVTAVGFRYICTLSCNFMIHFGKQTEPIT